MAPLLEMQDLVVEGFQDGAWQPIVRGISLHVAQGEVLGLIGESGAGKSTLGIAGMGYTRDGCRIVSGSIRFDGTELTRASEEELRRLRGARIAYVAQSAAASFNPAHSLTWQVAETPVEHRILRPRQAAERAVALYRRLQLPEPDRIGRRYPHQVSGGQLQRAMVAMALACSPDLVIFDEPTTALDVTTQIEVLAAIKEAIKQRDTAAIYISHDLALVAQIADRVMVLRNGRLIEQGPTRELLAHPKEAYTRALLAAGMQGTAQAARIAAPAPLLSLRNISAGYSAHSRVLEDVSIDVEPGETVAVVGESGSGKSTLARVIVGLLPPDQGAMTFGGETLPASYRERLRDVLRRIQVIHQMPDVALNPRQQVKDVIGRPLSFYFSASEAERSERVLELLDLIELGPRYADRYPAELSGGEKQRVCIARALAAKPDLIICDEVTSALDRLVAKGILELLERLQAELAVSYLFITHDLALVKSIADKVTIMHRGRVIEQGARDTVLSPPFKDLTRLLLSSVPEPDPDWLDRVLNDRRVERLS